ncbi:MAG: hypothetical protein J5829_06990 [Lachnospiraceae bacterium]|nr:hypothetical protein [Lachnospiraceae bacterium]
MFNVENIFYGSVVVIMFLACLRYWKQILGLAGICLLLFCFIEVPLACAAGVDIVAIFREVFAR